MAHQSERPDHSARIEEIQAVIRNGVSYVQLPDGSQVRYEFAALRRELRELMADDYDHHGRRPVASSIDLS